MKSLRIHSYDSRGKEFKNKHSMKKKDVSFSDRPTPLDFDAFIPWLCLELQMSKNVIVTRTNQVDYVRYGSKISKESSKSSKSKSRSTKMKSNTIKSDLSDFKALEAIKTSFASSGLDVQDAIPVTTYYDKRGHLVEIAIVGCTYPINRKVIKAFNICLPFHADLYKLSIRKGGLSHATLHEIGKLLPYSNITEVCLDDSFIPQGNYSVLLESNIKYLSLKRCGINDKECKKIAEKLNLNERASKTLLLLDLTSNNIMDEGAEALGEILKTNRSLLYLNLSGNQISDDGMAFILKYLKDFPLDFNDIKGQRSRRFAYLKARSNIYEKCLIEAKVAHTDNVKKSNLSKEQLLLSPIKGMRKYSRARKPKRNISPSFLMEGTTVEDIAEKKTREVIGEYEDPFKDENIKREGAILTAIGNLSLSYLNVAYNNLSLRSIKKILDVVRYQSEINKINQSTGLLTVRVDGNNILYCCTELYEIDKCLKKALAQNEQKMSTLSLTTSSVFSGKKILIS